MEEKMDPSDPQKMQFSNVNYWIVGVIALIVVVSIILFSQGKGGKSTTPPQTPSAGTSATKEQNVKVFDISAKPFDFSMKEIKVKKGDKVKINLTVTLGVCMTG